MVQIHRTFRKPLVVFTPKNLLRHPKCVSKLLEFDDKADDPNIVGVRFKRLIMDPAGALPCRACLNIAAHCHEQGSI